MDPVASLQNSTLWLVICFAVFGALHAVVPHVAEQRFLRKDIYVDIFYWMIGPLVYGSITIGFLFTGLMAINGGNEAAVEAFINNGAAWTQGMMLPVQALLALVLTDFIQYWLHRLFHMGRLWKYHAIHHAPESLDFLCAVRFHPINVILYSILPSCVALWIGFSPLAVALLAPFNVLYSCLVHANVDWDFGPFKKILSSPIFHRWHHTSAELGGSKNFAATFPLWDLMFGTYYMPKDAKPVIVGTTERDVPLTIIGQLTYPFKRGAGESAPVETDQASVGGGLTTHRNG